MRRLLDLWFGWQPAEFVSAYGLHESVERLAAATRRSMFHALAETSAVGKVTISEVRLQRVIPMVSNSFKPFFFGRFTVRNGVTVLTGHFTMRRLTKIFLCAWVTLLVVIGGVVLLTSLGSRGSAASLLVFQPFLMALAGVALTAAGRWLARNDVAWLSALIGRALGRGDAVLGSAAVGGDASASGAATVSKLPPALLVTALVLALGGLEQIGARFLPARSAPVPLYRDWHELLGLSLLLLSVAVWRRQPVGWWGGYMALSASLLGPWYVVERGIHGMANAPPAPIALIFGGMVLIASIQWGLWWFAQRKYFKSD